MKQYENDVERYLDEIGQLLPASKEKKECFLENFAEDIARHEEEVGTTVDYEGLVIYFGTPETIAKDYTSAWQDELMEKETTIVSCVPWRTILFWFCIVFLLSCIAWIVFNCINAFFTHDGDYLLLIMSNQQ